MGLGRRNPYKKREALFSEGEGGAHRCPEDKVSAAGVLARSSGFTTNLNACFKSLGRLNCNIGFFFLLASCQLQALIIIILQLACPSASYSSVNLTLTQLRSPVKDPIFETTEG